MLHTAEELVTLPSQQFADCHDHIAVAAVQAWLVPHTAEEEECSSASQGCGISSAAAVHSGFNASWQRGLKKSVCSTIQQAVEQSGSAPGSMQVLITGSYYLCL